jgi:hypothetical protein
MAFGHGTRQLINMKPIVNLMLGSRSLKMSFPPFSMGIIFKWIQDYEDAFKELVLLGQKTWEDDDSKKRRFVQNAQNIGMVDTVFEELVRDKSFIEACSVLRSHDIRHDQQNKEKATRQVNSTYQANKKDKVKQVLALVNELQIEDPTSSDEDIEVLQSPIIFAL